MLFDKVGTAQHSVHLTPGERWGRGGTRCVFKRFWDEAASVKAALSRPTHQYAVEA